MLKDQKIWCGNQEFSGCCHVRCLRNKSVVFSNFCGLSVCGWWPGGWCTVVIVGCQGPVVGAIYVFECVKNS